MPNPEIARRCQACGASVREAASFCRQCGVKLSPQSIAANPLSSEGVAPFVDLAPSEDKASARPGRRESEGGKLEPSRNATATPGSAPTAKAPPGKVRDQIQRATNLARDVEGDVIHRVRKVRQMSSVVLDEAGYDPSLRFILVAAALFFLSLLILLLNRLIG